MSSAQLSVTYNRGSTFLPPPTLTPNTSCSLSLRGSASSIGDLPGFGTGSSSDSDPSPPISPVRETAGISPRPSLRHMPSWTSFASHRSRREPDSSDDDEAFTDAPNEAGWEKRFVGGREREQGYASMRSSRKVRVGGGLFKLLNLRERSDSPSGKRADGEVKLDYRKAGSEIRVGTPLGMPILPRLHSRNAHSALAAMAETSPPSSPDEYFTPGAIASALLPSIASLLPTPTPVRRAEKVASRAALADAASDNTVEFNLHIFSPRMPSAPRLRGIMDAMPISPLELSATDPLLHPSIAALAHEQFATPVLPRNPASTPTMPHSEGSPVLPSRGSKGSDLASACKTSTPHSPARSVRNPSSPCASRRRMSAIIRPPILPSPTPPSLLNSPRTLGTPILPPRISSRRGAGPHYTYAAYTVDQSATLPTMRKRRLRGPISTSTSVGLGGLGLGAIGGTQEHVATPGTFGLEGEAERRTARESENPYFA